MQNSDDKCTIIFAKDPADANIKTRLGAQIGPAAAAELYKCFLLDALDTLNKLAMPFEIAFHPPQSELRVKSILGNSYHYMPQQGDDVGQRMKNAFLAAFDKDYKKVIVIGSDIPDLPVHFLKSAFVSLETNDAVVGPAADGGYYLIGFTNTSFVPQVFDDISWSSDCVFKKTLGILKKHTDRIQFCDRWYDIDTLNDLKLLLERHRCSEFQKSRTISFLSTIMLGELDYV
jgi:rSAM/selenodomain-associated transferase 1